MNNSPVAVLVAPAAATITTPSRAATLWMPDEPSALMSTDFTSLGFFTFDTSTMSSVSLAPFVTKMRFDDAS